MLTSKALSTLYCTRVMRWWSGERGKTMGGRGFSSGVEVRYGIKGGITSGLGILLS